MTETNKERLKRLKDDRFTINYYAGYDGLDKDILWLVERVERAEEIERELKECYKQNNNFSNEHWGLQAENKRFREALELLDGVLEFGFEAKTIVIDGEDLGVGSYNKAIMKALKALKGEDS